MSNLVEGYYHCDECDSIFESPMIGLAQQVCPHCGHVVAGESDMSSAIGLGDGFLLSEEEEIELGLGKQVAEGDDLRSRATNENRVIGSEEEGLPAQKEGVAMQLRVVLISWIILVVMAVAVVIYFNRSAVELVDDSKASEDNVAQQSKAEKQAMKLALPKCMLVAKGFLNAKSASAKAQFV